MLKSFPKPLAFKKLLGPSFVILALGLGSGEVILWPYIASQHGLGVVWAALAGITLQYFINMEIERYALLKGESVFVGLYRLMPWLTWWFIFSTFIGFGLPGIIAASAQVSGEILGISDFRWLGVGFLIGIGLILSSGKTVYPLVERITRTIIFIGIPCIILLVIILARKHDWLAAVSGLIGRGEGYWFLPAGLSVATFFGAFAYSGAGGNLNLTQSIYIKEKGYGMGAYAEKISGLFQSWKIKTPVHLEGNDFEVNEESVGRFTEWWKRISREHLIVFWFLGGLAMVMLMILSYITAFGSGEAAQGIRFVIAEGRAIGAVLGPVAGLFFLMIVTIMLFQTQLGVLDSTSRIMAENFALYRLKGTSGSIPLSWYYYGFLWMQIIFGISVLLLGKAEPKFLLILGAVINAITMFVHIGLVNYMNYKVLPKVFQPHWFRRVMIGVAFLVFGVFSMITVWDRVLKNFFA